MQNSKHFCLRASRRAYTSRFARGRLATGFEKNMKSVIQDFFVQEILLFFISSHKLGWYVRKWIITKQNGLLSASCQITFCSKEQAYRASCQISHCGKWWAFRAICKISCHGKQQSLGPAAMYVVENSGPLGPTAKLVVA